MTDFSQRKLIGKYSKKYAYAPYLNEDIGWEMECLPGDDPMEVQVYLKSLSDQTHKINNPSLYQDLIPQSYGTGDQQLVSSTAPLQIKNEEEKISAQQQEQNIISEIQKSNNKEELEALQLISNHSVKTKGEYKKRKKQLNIQ